MQRITAIKTLLFCSLCCASLASAADQRHSDQLPAVEDLAEQQSPGWSATHIVTADDYGLPYRYWYPQDHEPEAIVLGLHGLNDYSAGLSTLAEYLAENHNVATYSYDQRGFGATADRGSWAGKEKLLSDAELVSELLAERYPDKPLFIVGHSMGGGIAIRLAAERQPEHVDGLVLIAPAVWGRDEMPWYQRSGLWLATHLIPQLELRGDWVGVEPTDNPQELEKWHNDPLIQQSVKAETLEKVTELMGKALEATKKLRLPALILYGERDEVVPAEPICAMLERLPEPPTGKWRFALYPDGYHMLTRDLQRQLVLQDIGAWISHGHRDADLPSEHEKDRQEALQALCR
ncbi:lysophospholipase [Halorhodospira halochloris]|uniref:Lysophospholipase n=1 Tax=Halorhodospira halochloris TaxID=1052 RepID=A0A0X8X9V4_HALHR|nr:alpha/beta hydrolase [Halorhodospira halochloris]MBK1652571.1 hypothetical protein [Halorhodospira halochloris]BAU58161.1 lysophospholipase [Halorhodospira halochloris]